MIWCNVWETKLDASAHGSNLISQVSHPLWRRSFDQWMDLIDKYCLRLAPCFRHWLLLFLCFYFFASMPSLTHFNNFGLWFPQHGNILLMCLLQYFDITSFAWSSLAAFDFTGSLCLLSSSAFSNQIFSVLNRIAFHYLLLSY